MSVHFDGAQTNANPYEPAFTESSVTSWTDAWPAQACNCFNPLVVGDTVYTTLFNRDVNPRPVSIVARDVATGVRRWSRGLGTIQYALADTVANGIVYVELLGLERVRSVLALDAATGKVRWRLPNAFSVAENVIPAAGKLVYVRGPGGVSAVDPTGTVRWAAQPGGELSTVALDADGGVVVASYDTAAQSTRLTTYDAATGQLRRVVTPAVSGVPIHQLGTANGLSYASSDADVVYAIDPATGAVRWSRTAYEFEALASGSVVLFAPAGGGTYTLESRDGVSGALRWGRATASADFTIVAGRYVFSGSEGDIAVRRLSDGVQVGTIDGIGGIDGLAASDGRVFAVEGTAFIAHVPTG